MTYFVKINDKEYEVDVERGKAEVVNVAAVSAAPAPVAAPVAAAPVAAPAAAPAPAAAAGEGEEIKAPMPGTILAVKAQVGASVKAGEVLVVLEAMKMENEIVAPRDGVVSSVVTTKGATVDTGAVLLYLK